MWLFVFLKFHCFPIDIFGISHRLKGFEPPLLPYFPIQIMSAPFFSAGNTAVFLQNFIRSFWRLFVGFVEAIKKAPFFISRRQKGRLCLIHQPAGAFQDAPAYFFAYEEDSKMNHQNEPAQLRFLEETANQLRQNGFTVEPIEDYHLPVSVEKGRLCRISGKGSVLYRQENVDNIRA